MNCPKCGQELSDRSMFCPNCGAAILRKETEAVSQPPVEEVAAPAVSESPVTEEVLEVSPEAPVAAAVPKKTFWQKFRLPICIGTPVIALVLVVALNFNWFVGSFLKTFAKPETYYSHVEEATFTDLTSNVSKLYGSLFKTGEKAKDAPTGAKVNVKVSMGQQLISLLNNASGMELGWLSEVSVGAEMNSSGNLIEQKMNCSLGGGKIVEVHLVMDLENLKIWIGVPDLNPSYLELDLSTMFGGSQSVEMPMGGSSYGYDSYAESSSAVVFKSSDGGFAQIYELYMKVLEDAPEFLPSEEELNKLLDRYVKVALGAITDVEKGSDTISVGDLKQKVTTLEVEFSEETLLNVVTAVLEEAKDDDKLMGYIKDIESYVEKEFLDGEDTGLSKGLKEGIKMMLEELDDVDASDETVVTMTTFVNGNHEIVGREFKADKQDVLFYAKINKGSKFAFELEVAGQTIVEGSGKESGGKMTGTFEIGVMNQDIAEIELEEFDIDGLTEDGLLNGTVRIVPGEALLEQLDLPAGISDPELEFIFTSTEEKASIEAKLNLGGQKFVGITLSAEAKKGGSVSKPSNVKSATDEDDLMDWAQDVKFDKLIGNLKVAGVPSDLLDLLEDALDEIG